MEVKCFLYFLSYQKACKVPLYAIGMLFIPKWNLWNWIMKKVWLSNLLLLPGLPGSWRRRFSCGSHSRYVSVWVCVFAAEGDVCAQPWGGLFIPVCLTFCRARRRAMAEAWDTFISPDESCDSLEPSFCGLSVWVSFTLTTWMTGTGCWEGEPSYDRSLCLMARLLACRRLFYPALLCGLVSILIIERFAGHMRVWKISVPHRQVKGAVKA